MLADVNHWYGGTDSIDRHGAAMTDEVRLRDFSRKPTRLRFAAEGEEYECVSAFSPEGLQELLALARSFDAKNPDMTIMRSFFELTMFPESFERAAPRLDARTSNPLSLSQCGDIMAWLVEEYGQRPTPPSSSSTPTSETGEAGTSSAAGAPDEESTPSS